MRIPAVILLTLMAVTPGCKRPDVPDSTKPTPPPAASSTDSAKVDPEDPEAGKNTKRPDSVKDVAPGADGDLETPPR